MRGAWVLLVVGCNYVIPLDEDPFVTATLARVRVVTNPDGSLDRSELPFPGEDVSIVVHVGGEQAPATLDERSTFAFRRESGDERYRIVASVNGRITEIQHATPNLVVPFRALGRLARAPVTQPTWLELPRPRGIGFVMSSGIWARGQINLADMPTEDPVRYDWATAASYSGTHSLLDSSLGDRLYYFVFQPAQVGSAHFQLDEHLVVDNVIQTTGGVTMHGPLAKTTRDRCAHLVASRARDSERLAALPDVTMPAQLWSIEASVDPNVAFGLHLLAFAHDPAPADVDVTVSYANLVPETTAVAQVAVSAVNTITFPGADPLERRSTLLTRYLPVESDCSTPTTFSGEPALPIDLTIGGVAAAGNVTIDRSADVEVAWSLDGTEPVDYFYVTLFEVESVADSPRPRTVVRIHREIITVEPRVLIDPDVLARSARYIVQVTAYTGTPRARDGDFATAGTGSTLAQTLSPMFQVR